MMAIEIDDGEILSKFQNDSTRNEAFNSLLKKYQQKVYWHVRRMVIDHNDADDLVQNVFIKVWKALPGFRQDAGLYRWLYRVATNECITFLNKKKQRNNVAIDEVDTALSGSFTAASYFDGDKAALKLQQAILTLPDKQRPVFNMKYYDNLKYDKMSEILGTSPGALKASYHLAVKKIEVFLVQND